MRYKEETDNNQTRFKFTIELSNLDFIGIYSTEEEREFIRKKLSSKNLSDKIGGLLALVSKIEQKDLINLN